jgi:hypothetical protein
VTQTQPAFLAATWNVYHGSPPSKLRPVLRQLRDDGVTLFLMQEVSSPEVRVMLHEEGLEVAFAPRQYVVAYDPGTWEREGAVELVRLGLTRWFSTTGAPQWSEAVRVILRHRQSGLTVDALSYHTPAGVQRGGQPAIDSVPRRIAVLRESMATLTRLANEARADAVLYGGDDNVDEHHGTGWDFMLEPATGLHQVVAPEGTHDNRKIDDFRVRGLVPMDGRVVENVSDHDIHVRAFTFADRKEPAVATPMTPAQWRAQLAKFDVPFREIPDWDNPQSGRDQETGLRFGPVYGGVMHHTGNDLSDAINRKVILEGRSDLPGRLAHAGLADDGFIEMMTCWRANHAGGGDPDVLAAVKAESYGDYPPHTDKHQGEPGAVDGNDSLYGLETYYWKTLTPKQYKSAVGFFAAICDHHGWTAKSIIGHKEWSDWKPDPNLIDMKVFRRDIDARIDAVDTKQVAEPVGPKYITPNITKAIAANIAYDKALSRIQLDAAEDERDSYRAQIKKQRRALRDLERK